MAFHVTLDLRFIRQFIRNYIIRLNIKGALFAKSKTSGRQLAKPATAIACTSDDLRGQPPRNTVPSSERPPHCTIGRDIESRHPAIHGNIEHPRVVSTPCPAEAPSAEEPPVARALGCADVLSKNAELEGRFARADAVGNATLASPGLKTAMASGTTLKMGVPDQESVLFVDTNLRSKRPSPENYAGWSTASGLRPDSALNHALICARGVGGRLGSPLGDAHAAAGRSWAEGRSASALASAAAKSLEFAKEKLIGSKTPGSRFFPPHADGVHSPAVHEMVRDAADDEEEAVVETWTAWGGLTLYRYRHLLGPTEQSVHTRWKKGTTRQ